MSRLSRVTQKIFAGSASNNGVFGSAQANAGPGTLSNDLATIMGLAAWPAGWLDAIMGSSKFPPLEEFQAIQYVATTQLAYLLQQGIAEYDSGTTYYTNNVVMNPGTYQVYGSKTNGNVGHALSDGTNWQFLADLSGSGFGNVQTTTGTSHTYAAADVGYLTQRSNTGTVMTDTLPGTSPGVLAKGSVVTIVNTDSAAFLQINSGSGANLDGSSTNFILLGPGQRCILESDGSNYYSVSKPNRARCATTSQIFVSGSGSNSNNGLTSGTPFLTIQKAVDFIYANIDTNNQIIFITIADATYTGAVSINGPVPGGGTIGLSGNTTTPANCIISTTSANAITVANGAIVTVAGFKIQTTTSGYGIVANTNAIVTISGNMNFGAVATGYAQIYSENGGFITLGASYTISGAAAYHLLTQERAQITNGGGLTITITGTPAFATAFAGAIDSSIIALLNSITFSGSATGVRYSVTGNSVIDVAGAGATYLPGGTSGTTATGGQYI